MEGSKRVCGKCRLEKSLEDFPRDRNEKLGRRYWCKPCSQESNKIYKRNNPAKTSAWHKKWNDSHPESQKVWQGHKSRSEYFQQLEAQGGVCAICGNPETRRSTAGNLCQLPWDHNHTTGTFRSLLCNRCNQVIGKVGEDVSLLLKMVEYINEWRDK